MRILLIGATGQVGCALQRSLIGLGDTIPATRSGRLPHTAARCAVADLARPDTLPALIADIGPDVVVNAAAYTAVDKAESEAQKARAINAAAPAALPTSRLATRKA